MECHQGAASLTRDPVNPRQVGSPQSLTPLHWTGTACHSRGRYSTRVFGVDFLTTQRGRTAAKCVSEWSGRLLLTVSPPNQSGD